ncbi:hypothetical protein VTK73DRAFT_5058 [Phialemonium thermophilum]|uniref:Uncharacterized protein n=1 Tax=Phialemonium thermophilum TaxID=223376 RepID=A0ABR3V3Y5_9PEZI
MCVATWPFLSMHPFPPGTRMPPAPASHPAWYSASARTCGFTMLRLNGVTYRSSSVTSRKMVPFTAGSPAANLGSPACVDVT